MFWMSGSGGRRIHFCVTSLKKSLAAGEIQFLTDAETVLLLTWIKWGFVIWMISSCYM